MLLRRRARQPALVPDSIGTATARRARTTRAGTRSASRRPPTSSNSVRLCRQRPQYSQSAVDVPRRDARRPGGASAPRRDMRKRSRRASSRRCTSRAPTRELRSRPARGAARERRRRRRRACYFRVRDGRAAAHGASRGRLFSARVARRIPLWNRSPRPCKGKQPKVRQHKRRLPAPPTAPTGR